MALIIETKTDFPIAPEGLHPACVCVDAFSLGMVLNKKYGKEEHKVLLVFQLDLINPETGQRYEAAKRYTASLGEKAWLAMDLETWRGKKFTKDERKNFDLERVIGSPCQLQIIHEAKDDGHVYANINMIIPAPHLYGPDGNPTIKPLNYVRKVDRDEKKAASATPNGQNGQQRATPPPMPPPAATTGIPAAARF